MSRPQEPELNRSGHTPLNRDHDAEVASVTPHAPAGERPGGPVPEENRPGHHPPEEQDKPDLDAMAERLGVIPDDDDGDEGDVDEPGGGEAAEGGVRRVTDLVGGTVVLAVRTTTAVVGGSISLARSAVRLVTDRRR